MSAIHRPARRAVLLACCVLAGLPAAAGELYQWKDANGVTHYSDSPPPDRQYQSRIYGTDAGASVASADETTPATETSSQCTTARANLALLQGDGPVGMDSDKDGKPDSQLTAEQRTAQAALAEAAIKVHCTAATAAS